MKKLFLIICIFFFSTGFAIAGQTFYYQTYDESGEQDDHRFTLKFLEENETGWRAESVRYIDGFNIEEEYQLDKDFATVWWKVTSEGYVTDYEGRRVGDKLYLEGVLNGKELHREIEIDENPFHYNPKIGLMAFARSGEKEHDFWGIHNLILVRYNLIAENEGVEEIDVNGESVKAVKIKWKAKRVPSFIFNRTYWFRTSDYMYVKQREKNGIIRELIKVE